MSPSHSCCFDQDCRSLAHKLKELMCVCVCSVVSDSLQPQGLKPALFLCLWNFPGKNTGVGCHFLHQGIFPTQGLNCVSCISCIDRQILSLWHHLWGAPRALYCRADLAFLLEPHNAPNIACLELK